MKKKERSFEPGELEGTMISLPGNLLNKFEKIARTRGYSSRSEAIRDAIRAYIIEYKQMEDYGPGEEIGIITYLYDHSQRGIGDELLVRQSHHMDVIRTVHTHLDEVSCLETIVVKGEADGIRKLAGDIMSLRGVKNTKLSVIPVQYRAE